MSGPRVLVAGLGSMGRRHLRNLLALGVEDVLLLRSTPHPPEGHSDLPIFTDVEAALEAGPDLVVISTPPAHHLEVALPAARAGCHLFIEKPLSAQRDGVDELCATAEDRRLVVAVGYDLRLEPGLQHVRKLLAGGSLGEPLALQTQVGQHLPDWRPDQDYRSGITARRELGGGVLLELSHELDYAAWLLGPVRNVSCLAARLGSLEMGTENLALVHLEFAGGALASIQLDCLDRVPSRTCRVVCERGTVLWDYHDRSVRWFEAASDGIGGPGAGRWDRFDYPDHRREERFREEMRRTLNAVTGLGQPPAGLEDGRRALELALAAAGSARTGVVVPVPGPAAREAP